MYQDRSSSTRLPRRFALLTLTGAVALALNSGAIASSHREGPAIAMQPSVDGTDFYMFRSYENGRSGYVTLIANYNPFQDPQGGPNFYQFNPTRSTKSTSTTTVTRRRT